jgi:putative PIN family toxin of toxin-antitoxin system
MQRIIVDTNVLVSALIQRNFPYYILNEIFANNELELCVSDSLLQEYYEVLNRKKFSKFPDFVSNAQFILTEIEHVSKKFSPKIKLS